MKQWKMIICIMLIVAMVSGDLSLLNVRADNGGISVSENSSVINEQAGVSESDAPVSDVSENNESVSENEANVSGNDIPMPEDEESVSENDTPAQEEVDVSENDMTVSGNETTVSGNEVTPEEDTFDADWDIALEKLHELTASKLVMALVYLTDSYEVKAAPDLTANTIAIVNSGQAVLIKSAAVSRDGTVWYQAEFEVEGITYDGYFEPSYLAYSDEDLIAWEENYLLPYLEQQYGKNTVNQMGLMDLTTDKSIMSVSSGYSDIDQFPQSYWSALCALKKKYPKWTFVKLDVTNLDFSEVVNAQYGERSYIWKTAPEEYRDGQTGQANWYYASKKAISYYMDPRKHLSEKEVFQFELLSYNGSYHTENALQGILSSTFMAGAIPGEGKTYAKAFMEIGSNYSISPYHLASRVVLEQGTSGSSPLISGTYPGYEGYYNYFNVGASGSTDTQVIVNGLAYAKSKGWNTRYASLLGGAGTIGNNYIKIGQNTLYLQKFQVIVAGKHSLYTHQYQQNIQAPTTEGTKTYNTYNNSGSLNNSFVFRIPVYSNMSSSVKRVELNAAKQELKIMQSEEDGIVKAKPESVTLTATVFDTDEKVIADYPVTWKSENTKVATVDANGTVTAVAPGTTNIVATADGKKIKCAIIVKAPLYRIEILPPSGEIYVGESAKLDINYIPLYTTDPVENMKWSSSDENIAVVYKGLVSGKASGNAVITAKVTGEDGTEHMAEYALTVKSCLVQFFDDRMNVLKSIELGYGEMLDGVFPDSTELTGHENDVFSGWYSQPDGKGFRCTGETIVYSDLNLYPHFISTDQDFFVKNVGDYTYTGQAIKPEVEVYDGETLLVKGTDYTVSYSNNKAVAGADSVKKPTITVKGKGNYSGTQKVYFNIVEKNIAEADITVEDMVYSYSGKTIKPNPTVYRDGKKLKKGTDYTLNFPSEGTGAYLTEGIFAVEICGIKNYAGTRKVYLTITKNVLLSKVSVSSIKNQEYASGNPVEPALTVKYKGAPLEAGVHYTVEYQNNTEIGTATAVLTAVDGSGYSGTKTVKFKITGVSMSKVKVSGITSQAYCGSPITVFDENGNNSGFFPDFAITYTDSKTKVVHELILNKDYTIEYSKNEAKGKAAITFRGMGNYAGTLKKSFTINAYDVASNTAGYIYLENTDLGVQEYSRAGAKPKVQLYFKDAEGNVELLQERVDYTLSYVNNKYVNDGTNPEKIPAVTIKGKGRFKGTWKAAATFAIGAKSIGEDADNGITVTATDFVYKEGKEDYAPKVVVKDNGKTLKAGKDYEIVSYRKVNQGETGIIDYEVTLQALTKEDGTTEYTGTRTASYRVYLYTLSKASIQKIPNQTFEDKTANSDAGICPDIVMTYKLRSAKEAELFNSLGYELYDTKNKVVAGAADGTNIILKKGDTILLKESRDYTFAPDSYKNNKKKGTAKVTVYGTDLFAGSKSASYKIVSRPLVQRIVDLIL